VLRLAEKYLDERCVESSRLSSERLLAAVLNIDRMGLYLQFDRPLEEKELVLFREHIRRRADGEPLQYILGSTGFRELTLKVGPGVLIPRPETEQLAGLVLSRLDGLLEAGNCPLRILDLCAGSGAVGLSLAAEREGLWCVLAELREEATHWARLNMHELGSTLKSPACIVRADLFGALSSTNSFDIVVSNPPYVSESEMTSLPANVRDHEPHSALAAGTRGLDVIERIMAGATEQLRSGGLLALEIGEEQQDGIEELLAAQAPGAYGKAEFHSDMAGKTRFVTVYRL